MLKLKFDSNLFADSFIHIYFNDSGHHLRHLKHFDICPVKKIVLLFEIHTKGHRLDINVLLTFLLTGVQITKIDMFFELRDQTFNLDFVG